MSNEPEITSEMEQKSTQPINFSMVLMRQADRILAAMTEAKGDFITGVDGFEIMLAPYIRISDEYHNEMKRINKEVEKEARKHELGDGTMPREKVHALAIARATLKMKALMLLAGKSGLLPEQRIDWNEPD